MTFNRGESNEESRRLRFGETQPKAEIQSLADTQHPENKPLTETDTTDTKSEKQNLVSGLFSALENDQDLKLVVENWLELPEHIKAAIKALVQTHIQGD